MRNEGFSHQNKANVYHPAIARLLTS